MEKRTDPTSPFGHALKAWRITRGLSQLALAVRAETPSRHVSFLETGRARPSRAMVLRLAEALDLPLEERNTLLMVAGFSPAFSVHRLDDTHMQPIRQVIDRLLERHAPFPGLVLDRWYDVIGANKSAVALFFGGHTPDPDDPPNLVESLMGPLGDALVNRDEVLADGLRRLRRHVHLAPGDQRLLDLLRRLEAFARAFGIEPSPEASPVLFTRYRMGDSVLSTLSTLVHFGGVHDVTVEGLHVELIYPADPQTEGVFDTLGS